MTELANTIQTAFANHAEITPDSVQPEVKAAIIDVLQQLDQGKIRVSEKVDGQWQVNQWIKQAILLSFRIYGNEVMNAGPLTFYDKVPLKYSDYSATDFQNDQVRVVPGAIARTGSYIGKNCILMPSFVNIGAYVDDGCMVDTWASVGSCAQIGKNVHLSGGVGIGGVLEPLQANPTIIEDDCFIGARSEIVEGVIVERGSVISMGVYLSQSTRIYNRETKEVFYGRVPAGSVVVPGNMPSEDGTHSMYAAIIVKQVDEKTRGKVDLNELLRGIK
jgi:2,3,4,5-tetrahydropyridine-2-carboxylate N-succinyltransferase